MARLLDIVGQKKRSCEADPDSLYGSVRERHWSAAGALAQNIVKQPAAYSAGMVGAAGAFLAMSGSGVAASAVGGAVEFISLVLATLGPAEAIGLATVAGSSILALVAFISCASS